MKVYLINVFATFCTLCFFLTIGIAVADEAEVPGLCSHQTCSVTCTTGAPPCASVGFPCAAAVNGEKIVGATCKAACDLGCSPNAVNTCECRGSGPS